jgi:HK97 family phage major capsid protein
MTIEELRAFIRTCGERMATLAGALTEDRSAFTDDEQSEWDTLDGQVRDAEAQIERLERIEQVASRAGHVEPAAHTPTAPNVNTRGGDDVWDLTEVRRGVPAVEVRGRALTAIESLRGVTDREREQLTTFVERFDNRHGDGARHILATASPAYREAWRTALLDDPMFLTDEQRNVLQQARAISLTSGFAFPSTVDPTLLYIGNGSRNEIRMIADVRTIVTKDHDVNTVGAVTASMDGEAAEVSDDTPADDTVNIAAKKAQAFVEFTIESEQDLVGLETDLRTALSKGKDDLEASQMAIGSGAGNNVQGVMIGATTTVASAGAAAFAVADLYALQSALPPEYEAGAAWLAAKATYNRVRQFGTSDSHALWTRLSEDMPEELLGDPIYRNSSVVSTVSTGNEILAYGDFRSGYRVVDRAGMSVERVALMMDTAANRPNGKRGLYAYWRFGAAVTNVNALRVLSIA